LPAPELEDDDLLAAVLGRDLGRDRRALHQRLPDPRGVAAQEEHLVEAYFVALGAGQLLHAKLLPFGDPILFAARLDDRVHVLASNALGPLLRTAKGRGGRKVAGVYRSNCL